MLLGFRIAGRETLPINLTQRADECVSVFAANFALRGCDGGRRELPCSCRTRLCRRPDSIRPTEIKWQLTRAREIALCAAQIVHCRADGHGISFGPSIIENTRPPCDWIRNLRYSRA